MYFKSARVRFSTKPYQTGHENVRLKEQKPNELAGVAQLVECQLPKLNVAGSNPVSRSNNMSPVYFSLSAIRVLFTRRGFGFTQNSDIKVFIIFKLNHRIGKISFG